MRLRYYVVAAFSALLFSLAATASQSPHQVVAIRCDVKAASFEHLDATVMVPLLKEMKKIGRVQAINSKMSDQSIEIEIAFEGGSTDEDLATVVAHVGRLDVWRESSITSRVIQLRPATLID